MQRQMEVATGKDVVFVEANWIPEMKNLKELSSPAR